VAIANDYCFTQTYGNTTSSFQYSCNSSSIHITSCQGGSCSVNCSNFDIATGCPIGSTQSFSCIASSPTSSHHSPTSSHHSPTSSTSQQPYLILNLYTSSTCSGNEISFYAIPTACRSLGFGAYESASCNNGRYAVSVCYDAACSNCTATVSNLTSCSSFISNSGVYATATCGNIPNKSYVANTYYPNNNCTGSLYGVIGTITGLCSALNPLNTTDYVIYSCNSTYTTVTTCLNSGCSQNCSSIYTPIGCLNGSVYSTSCHMATNSSSHSIIKNSSSRLSYGNTIPILYCLLFLVFFVKSKKLIVVRIILLI